jgi:hypothetical protein
MIGGVERKPGTKSHQKKIDEITVYLRDQDKESNNIKDTQPRNKGNQDSYRDLGPKFDKVSEVISEVTTNYKQTEQ